MSKIVIAIPTLGMKFLGGIKFSLLLFTSDFLAYIDDVKTIGRAAATSPLAIGISMIAFGISGKARKFIESIEKMKGMEVSLAGIEKICHKKKCYILSYNNVERIRVTKGIRIVVEVHTRKKRHKHNVNLSLYKEIGKTRDEVYREIINALNKLPVKLETP